MEAAFRRFPVAASFAKRNAATTDPKRDTSSVTDFNAAMRPPFAPSARSLASRGGPTAHGQRV